MSRRFDADLLPALDQAYRPKPELHRWVELSEDFHRAAVSPRDGSDLHAFLPAPEGEEVVFDYASLGLALRTHHV